MILSEIKLNVEAVVKEINIIDRKIKIRLMELGLNVGTKILVKNRSVMNRTMLVVFNSSCFTLKENLARNILVNYA